MSGEEFGRRFFTTVIDVRAFKRRMIWFALAVVLGLGVIAIGWSGRNDPESGGPALFFAFSGVLLCAAGLVQTIRLARIIRKIPPAPSPSIAIDDKGLHYVKIHVKWSDIEDVILCKALRKRCVGVRTINNDAAGKFIQRTNFPTMALDGRIAFDRARRKTGCAIIIFPVVEATPEELRDLILAYRSHFLSQLLPTA